MASTSKHRTPSRKQPQSKQITFLYNQFESLKSKIYSSKSHKKENSPDKIWNNTQNYYDAQSHLRESTIRMYSKQFKEQLQLIKESRKLGGQKQSCSLNRQLFAPPSLQPQQPIPRQKEEKTQKLFALFKQKISGERQRQPQKTDVLSTVLQNYKAKKGNTEQNAGSEKRFMEVVKSCLRQYQNHQSQILRMMLDRLNFFNKKMSYLQKIMVECSKIMKVIQESRRAQEGSEKSLVIDLKTIENRYQAEIKELVRHYQEKISQLNHQSRAKLQNQTQANSYHGLQEENLHLKLILHQTKQLLHNKEEIIASLQDENLQLRKTALLKSNNEKEDLSLGYSLTGRKIKVQGEKMNSSGPQKHKWEDLQQPDEDINFNELESVKEKSFEEWNISQLEMRQNTNTKSMAGDFKEIYDHQADQSQ